MEIKTMKIMILVSIISCIISIAFAAQGTATFYTKYIPSACYGNRNDGVMIAAASDVFWNNKAACGKRYSVKCIGPTNNGIAKPCTGKSVVVKIVDYCPPGCQGTIDLSQQAFQTIANPIAGKVQVQYQEV